MASAVASCDEHLAMHLKMIAKPKEATILRVTRVEDDTHYVCTCGVSATWYARQHIVRKGS